jgi:gliding motility-associated-like protein
MRFALLRLSVAFISFICLSPGLSAQSCFNTGLNGTVINLPCNKNCLTVPLRIPHLKSTSDYAVMSVPYNPFPYATATGTQDPVLYIDDRYSNTINLPFPFCFYDSVFTKIVAGSNGVVTFDYLTNGSGTCANAYHINPQIPFGGNSFCNQGAQWYYPQACIMGAYFDMDPSVSPPDRKIQWDVFGTAPCRKFVISYYHVGIFGPACGAAYPNTFQIVLNESSGIIDIYFEQKLMCGASSDQGKGILGIQDWTRTKAVAAPGKNATQWSATNEGYRFVPSGGASRFVKSEAYDMGGTFLALADTITTTPGILDVTFPALCPLVPTGQYVVKTIFSACDNGATQIISYDTITINKTNSLNATSAHTQTACGVIGTGTITVSIPAGLGTAPFTYVLNPGNISQTNNNVFTGLTANNYTINVTDAAGCSSLVRDTITSTGQLSPVFTPINPSCPGANNGSITVTVPNGTPPVVYSIMGGPLTTTNTFNGLTALSPPIGSTYFFIINDNGGCSFSGGYTLYSNPSSLTGTAIPTNTSCTGASNGSITVTATSGSGPYQYSLNGGAYQTNNVFNGLAPGTYSIIIQEAGLCVSSPISVTINAGSALLATAVSAATSCNGAADGTITVTPGNGSAPYQYSLDGGAQQANNNFNNVSAGPHNIIVRDGSGCLSAPIPVTVAAGPALIGTATSTATACAGVNNGTVTATATSSTGPYQYGLDGGAYQVSNTFINVSAGAHNVIIKNALGCTSLSIPVTVAAGASVTATTTATSTACVGVNNGSITVTPTNGSAPYQYSLDGGGQQASNTFIGVSAGLHNIIVTDNFGCTSAGIAVTVAAGTALIATSTTTATACAGVNNGSITITPTNGSAPYQYSLDGGGQQASNTFTGVSSGPHNVVVTDNFGCISAPISVNIATGGALTGTAVSTATSCNGAVNGTITATATSGSAPYQYSLDGGASQASNTFIGVSSGPHTVIVRDNFGCISAPISVSVAAGSSLNATATSASTSCNGATNGSIIVTPPTNGTSPYQYSINANPPQAGAVFNGLASGLYTIAVTDAGGCNSGNIPVTIVAGPVITVTPSKTDAACFGSATGSITVIPSANATAPIQYSLNNVTWQVSPNFTGLVANTYTVYIRDAVGCSNSAAITIGQPSQLAAATAVQNVLCKGAGNGVITVNASGGTTGYSFSLNNVTYQPGNTFNVAAGIYTVYVKDANGCSIPPINNINVAEPALLTATPVTGNATCDGGNDGNIAITAAGGTSAYQYSLNGGPYQASAIFNVGPGTFDVTVKDANGCTFPVNGIIVGLTNNLTYTPMTDPVPICEGSSIQLQAISNATQFAWTPVAKLSTTTIANPIANPAIPTLYTVTATLGRCFITDDVFVDVIAAPVPDAGNNGDICYGQSYQLQPAYDPTYTYAWTPPAFLSSTTIYNPVANPDKTKTYTLSVTDGNGCPSLVTDQVTVNVTPPIKVTTYPADTVVYAGVQVSLLATSPGTSYVWSPAAGLNNPNIANPIATAPIIDGSIVIYQATTTTSAGCQGQGYIRIQVYKGPDIYVATGFTPNNDGKNDEFIPFPVGIKKLNYFRVFNRWGQLLYSTTTLNRGWDGRFGGAEQASGVYIWMAEAVTMDNKIISKKGTVTLIR